MSKILITGGSGLIGQHLTHLLLSQGHQVNWLSRSSKNIPNVAVFEWDINKQTIDKKAFEGVEVLIHLAGEGIADKRWTKKRKQQIITSRTESTQLLNNTLKTIKHSVKQIICASAIGYYGDGGETMLDEDSKNGIGFLAESVRIWEEATEQFSLLVPAFSTLRFGIVLAKEGGAFPEIMMTKKFGILPVFGNGKQIYSWIHVDDVCGIITYVLNNKITGLFNAVAPNPVTQKQFMQATKKEIKGLGILFPVPAFGLRILLGKMSDTILISQNISAKKILEKGYQFKYSELNAALVNLLKK